MNCPKNPTNFSGGRMSQITKKLNTKSFNKEAQKGYWELTDEQRTIDIFIAERILKSFISKEQAKKELKKDLKKNMLYLHRGDKTYLFNLIDNVLKK